MPICKLQAPFAQLSGAIGKPSGQNGQGGVVAMPDLINGRTLLRSYVSPIQPNSNAQIGARANLSSVVEAYQSLSIPQVEAWQALAIFISGPGRLNLTKKLSWTQLFQQVNNYRLQYGQEIVLDPPATTAIPGPTGITSVASDDESPDQGIHLVIGQPVNTYGGYLAVRFTRDLGSPVRQARDTDFRYADIPDQCILPRPAGANPTLNLNATTVNIFSTENIGVEIRTLNAGFVPISRIRAGNIVVGSF